MSDDTVLNIKVVKLRSQRLYTMQQETENVSQTGKLENTESE